MAAKIAIKKGQDGQKFRFHNGFQVNPTMYNGRATGDGKYLTGSIKGEMVLDENGSPLRWRDIGYLATSARPDEQLGKTAV